MKYTMKLYRKKMRGYISGTIKMYIIPFEHIIPLGKLLKKSFIRRTNRRYPLTKIFIARLSIIFTNIFLNLNWDT